MLVHVRMLAFAVGAETPIRAVSIPDAEIPSGKGPQRYLDLVFHYGQNEVCPKRINSLSAGDVIVAEGLFFMINHAGFTEISAAELARYEALPRRERHFDILVRGK